MKIKFLLLCSLACSLVPSSVFAQPDSGSILCADGICRPAIAYSTYFDRPAYTLTNGRFEAVVVPEIGRIMRFAKVGGANLLWNTPTSKGINMGYQMYGGDKNWLAPQSAWKELNGAATWPPDPAHDGTPHEAEVISGGKLRMWSPVSKSNGIRFERLMYFDDKTGEFVVEQSAIKEKGKPMRASIWNISQVVPGEAVYLPLNLNSAYENKFHWLSEAKPDRLVSRVNDAVLKVVPEAIKGSAKIGVDSPIARIASVTGDVAWLQKAAKPAGIYPDGAEENGVKSAGFPVEFYMHENPEMFFVELELLSPLRDFIAGSKWTHTMRWSLHDLPEENQDEFVANLLTE